MTKQCAVCGAAISSDDWYAFIRMKYCEHCRQEIRRIQKAEQLRELRRKRKEINAATRELCKSQQEAIELLRAELIRSRERIAALKGGGGHGA